MADDFIIVSTKVLPDYFKKVLEAKTLLETKKAVNVTDAAKQVGISRTTYYKYKDYVFQPEESNDGRKAVINMILAHRPGILSKVIRCFSDLGVNILTVSQSMPVIGRADVMVTLDISNMTCTAEELLSQLQSMPDILSASLEAIG